MLKYFSNVTKKIKTACVFVFNDEGNGLRSASNTK